MNSERRKHSSANLWLVFFAALIVPCCFYLLQRSPLNYEKANAPSADLQSGPEVRPPISSQEFERLNTGVRHYTTVINVSGKGESADWGLATVASFVLTYNFVCEAEILRKERTARGGMKVVERRKFVTAKQVLQLSDADVRLAIKECVHPTMLGLLYMGAELAGQGCGIQGVGETAAATVELLDGVSARKLLGGFASSISKDYDQLVDRFINRRVKNMFKSDAVEGKTYIVTYLQDDDSNAPSMVSFKHENGDERLTEDERMVLRRANAFIDSRFMPDENTRPGDVWEVDSGDFSCLLDPYVDGSYCGKLKAERVEDLPNGDWVIKVHPGAVAIRGDNGRVDGFAEVMDGVSVLEGSPREIRQMQLVGKCGLQRRRNGFFFKAKIKGDCNFTTQLKTELPLVR